MNTYDLDTNVYDINRGALCEKKGKNSRNML